MNADEAGLWVRSDLLPNGTYGVAISVGPDRAWTLTRDRAIAYAAACVGKATEAEHDCAVYGLLVDRLQLSDSAAAAFVLRELLPHRVTTTDADTAPIKLVHAIGRRRSGKRERVAVVQLHLEGRNVGDMSPTSLREHAQAVLSVIAAANLDEQLFRLLRSAFDLDEPRARAVVSDLAEHWPRDGRPA